MKELESEVARLKAENASQAELNAALKESTSSTERRVNANVKDLMIYPRKGILTTLYLSS